MRSQQSQLITTDQKLCSTLFNDAVLLLKDLISTPSYSGDESKTADLIQNFLHLHGAHTRRTRNNVWSYNYHYDPAKPTILLNSHHDTVNPNTQYTRNPFDAHVDNGILYGLGSNDAGGCLVSLMATFLYFFERKDLAFNLCYAATAEEENSGDNGLKLILPELGRLDFGIVGEPTLMKIAVAERGLMVLDCVSTGKAGHAAREEGVNAIYKCIQDIEWFRNFAFPKVSDTLGPVKMQVTIINAGSLHNMLPGTCNFTVDVRMTDAYTFKEVLNIIREHVNCEIVPRDFCLHASAIDKSHPIVQAGLALGCETYGSPTTSDQALLSIPSIKFGPGDSARSHMADEYIFIEEIELGIKKYISLLEMLVLNLINHNSNDEYEKFN
jgi:acetylornithine deacetylase